MLCTQTWREKQRLCDAVLPTIADQVNDSSSASVPILSDECKQMNDGAKWLLSDFTLFSMAEKTLPAMDLAKLKSCVGVRPLALLLCLCTASLHYFPVSACTESLLWSLALSLRCTACCIASLALSLY